VWAKRPEAEKPIEVVFGASGWEVPLSFELVCMSYYFLRGRTLSVHSLPA